MNRPGKVDHGIHGAHGKILIRMVRVVRGKKIMKTVAILPIFIQCAWCRAWKQPDGTYGPALPPGYNEQDKQDARLVSHGICTPCLEKMKEII